MGNSLLQSGTAVGAVLAPLAIMALVTEEKGGWRLPFLVIGAGGCAWVLFWLLSIRPRDLPQLATAGGLGRPGRRGRRRVALRIIFSQRYLGLVVMVVFINLNWHLFRVWMPKYLQEARGYSQNQMLQFSMLYYLAADVGVMSAGAASQWMSRRGFSVYASRMWAFFGCALPHAHDQRRRAAAGRPAADGHVAGRGLRQPGMLRHVLLADARSSQRHQGKVSGTLATCTWMVTGQFHNLFGWYLDRTHNYDLAFGATGWLPMLALVAVLFFWRSRPAEVPLTPQVEPMPEPVEVVSG